jgi:AbrB family looped-hinge helix DNA binding protein
MSTMVTIDSAGRVVLPKRVRDHHGLGAGSELELDDSGTEIKLRPVQSVSPLKEINGFLVFTGRFAEDTQEAVRRDRDARLRHVAKH